MAGQGEKIVVIQAWLVYKKVAISDVFGDDKSPMKLADRKRHSEKLGFKVAQATHRPLLLRATILFLIS